MANKALQKKYEKLALKIIEDEPDIAFVEELASYMNISRATFYNHALDKLDSIKESLEVRRTHIKKELRAKWRHSDNTTQQVILYKLLATEDEWKRIQSSRLDIVSDGEKVQNISYVVADPQTEDDLRKLEENGGSPD